MKRVIEIRVDAPDETICDPMNEECRFVTLYLPSVAGGGAVYHPMFYCPAFGNGRLLERRGGRLLRHPECIAVEVPVRA